MEIQSHMVEGALSIKLPEHFPHESLLKALHQSVENFGLKFPCPVLLDATDVKQASSGADIAVLAFRFGKLPEHVGPNFAIIVGDDLHYGLARMFASLAAGEGCNVEVFRSAEDANTWVATL